jgi:hypothetical protein
MLRSRENSCCLQGYTIPLDKRLAADVRGLQQVHINENFAKLAEALYIADRKVWTNITSIFEINTTEVACATKSLFSTGHQYLVWGVKLISGISYRYFVMKRVGKQQHLCTYLCYFFITR